MTKTVRLSQWVVFLFLLNSRAVAQKSLEFDKYELLAEISTLIQDHFYDTTFNGSDWNQRLSSCRQQLHEVKTLDQFDLKVNELLASLSTSHTYFFSRNNPKRFQLFGIFHELFDKNDTSLFRYEGIGVDTRIIEGKHSIVSIFDGFPAAEAGLRFGDQILTVDGKAFHPTRSFVAKASTSVTIDLARDQEQHTIKVPVTVLDGRTMFEIAMESSIQVIDQNEMKIGYVHIWSYAGLKYHEKLREAILWGQLSDCDGLIVDLRDGWGGADINNLSLFRKPIALIESTSRQGDIASYSGVWGKPVALITNGRSTSGKELFAYGFQKLGLGKIIGERTAGAVVAGRIFRLSSGDLLYIAVNDVHVDGERLEGVGVTPNIIVDRPIESMSSDPQLERALMEILSN